MPYETKELFNTLLGIDVDLRRELDPHVVHDLDKAMKRALKRSDADRMRLGAMDDIAAHLPSPAALAEQMRGDSE